MWPEDCAQKLLTSPLTQIEPICFSRSRRICSVSSPTEKTLRVVSVGNSSPKSHCDLDLLIKNFRDFQSVNFSRDTPPENKSSRPPPLRKGRPRKWAIALRRIS